MKVIEIKCDDYLNNQISIQRLKETQTPVLFWHNFVLKLF